MIEARYIVTIRNEGEERALDRQDVEDALKLCAEGTETGAEITVEAVK